MKESTYSILTKLPFVSTAMIATGNDRMPFSGLGTSHIPDKVLKWMNDHPDEVLTVNIYKKIMDN